MQTQKKLPQLAISLTDDCNYKCYYCRPSGSSVNKCTQNLPFEEFVRLLSIAYRKGYRVFRITGGEPILRPDLVDIIKAINSLGNDTTILLGTNGTLLGDYIGEFKKYSNLKFFVGLDSINKSHKGLPKGITQKLYNNLSDLSKSNFVRINMLVLNSNKEDVWDMISFCSSLKIDLKLHDLYYCEKILDTIHSSEEFFDKEYYNVNQLIPSLSKRAKKISKYPENASDCGIPMMSFNIDGINVIIKDSLKGSYYNSGCKSCSMYPCLHGLYCPIIESNGTLQPSNCINKKFHKLIAHQSMDEVEKAFDFVYSVINNSKFETIDESSLNANKRVQNIDLVSKVINEKHGCDLPCTQRVSRALQSV
ncbi:MAG: radical SAM protein [Planctomycetes bacterium]|nr:radical SAM protein [Planctomycetota bacterium]